MRAAAWRCLPRLGLALAGVLCLCGAAQAQSPDAGNDVPRQVMQALRSSVVSVRTLVNGREQPVSTGSGFFASADGRIVTNYHVVSSVLRKPRQHRLEVALPGGALSGARVVGFSLADDLAVLKLDRSAPAGSRPVLLPSGPAQAEGSSVFAFGDAFGMGIVTTRGHHSGQLGKLGFERLHFTGTLNPGMSGGPAVTAGRVLVGVNAASRRNAEQMGFLVPAARVRALLARTADAAALTPPQVTAEIGRQLHEFQAEVARVTLAEPTESASYGPYLAPLFGAARLQCRPIVPAADDEDDGDRDPPAVEVQGSSCRLADGIDLDDSVTAGQFLYSHRHVRARAIGALRFNSHVDGMLRGRIADAASKAMAAASCESRYLHIGPQGRLPARLIWCAQAYREFEGLYDVNIRLLTRDRPGEALLSSLQLIGVSWPTALAYSRRLLESVQ